MNHEVTSAFIEAENFGGCKRRIIMTSPSLVLLRKYILTVTCSCMCTRNTINLQSSSSSLNSRQRKNISDNMASTDSSTPEKTAEQPGKTSGSWLSDVRIPGVANIEAAYSRAGASNHHTPGYASQLGSQDQKGGSEHRQGVGSKEFEDSLSDQNADPNSIGKTFNNMVNGTDRTK